MEAQNLNSGSISELPSNLTYETTGENRLVSVLYRKVEEMEQQLHELKTQKIIDETQFPSEILENSGLLPCKPKKLKRGRGYRQLLQSEIEEAKKHSPFAAAQARWLNVSVNTYRKYSLQYGIYEPRPNEKGKRNMFDPNRGKYVLAKILEGEYYDNLAVTDWMVKDKLIRSGKFPPKCNICDYSTRRIVDRKICLILDHKDGDGRNFKIDNLQLLCLNCTFECGRGYIRRGKHMFDPDWMQGAQKDEIDQTTRW